MADNRLVQDINALETGRGRDYKPSNSTISPLDVMIVELMLMVDSDYFFGWGETSINNLVYRDRYADKSKKHVSIFDRVDYSYFYGRRFAHIPDG